MNIPLHTFMFWVAVFAIVSGCVLGIIGIWKPHMWFDTGWKLFWTDVVLAISALLLAAVTKWLA